MIYLVIALKPEAQAFVDKYKLTKSKLGAFTLFSNENMKLIVSGMGIENARIATQTLINNFDISDDDIYINIGICGADKTYNIGQLVEIGTISYEEIPYVFHADKATLTCVSHAISEDNYTLVDMESYGFYDAVTHNPAIKQFFIFKVVSDHFQPHLVTKDASKSLIFNAIDAINNIIFN